jgi:hypothetical protein
MLRIAKCARALLICVDDLARVNDLRDIDANVRDLDVDLWDVYDELPTFWTNHPDGTRAFDGNSPRLFELTTVSFYLTPNHPCLVNHEANLVAAQNNPVTIQLSVFYEGWNAIGHQR